jgi:hypothetical protein
MHNALPESVYDKEDDISSSNAPVAEINLAVVEPIDAK